MKANKIWMKRDCKFFKDGIEFFKFGHWRLFIGDASFMLLFGILVSFSHDKFRTLQAQSISCCKCLPISENLSKSLNDSECATSSSSPFTKLCELLSFLKPSILKPWHTHCWKHRIWPNCTFPNSIAIQKMMYWGNTGGAFKFRNTTYHVDKIAAALKFSANLTEMTLEGHTEARNVPCNHTWDRWKD